MKICRNKLNGSDNCKIWWLDPFRDQWGLIVTEVYDGDTSYNQWFKDQLIKTGYTMRVD